MAISGPVDLLDVAESLGLLRDSEAVTLRAEWIAHGTLTTAQAAAELVERRLMTPYQAQQLLKEDGESLVVGGRYMPGRLVSIVGRIEPGCGVAIRNNLLLATTGPDIEFAGEDPSVLESWNVQEPPEDAEPWDWELTWRSRARRTEALDRTAGN